MELPLQELISKNILTTYLRVGLSVAGAQELESKCCRICLGPIDHPVCNFGIGLSGGTGPLEDLLGVATMRPHFNVYLLPNEEGAELYQLLRSLGFRGFQQLVCLTGSSIQGEGAPMAEQLQETGRRETSRFMVSQFMARAPLKHRNCVIDAISSAKDLHLYRLASGRRTVGAVMVSETEQAIGLYNLCVAPSARGKGVGTSILKWASGYARSLGKHLTLQCEPPLQPWYEELGFQPIGNLRVLALARAQSTDIIKRSIVA